MNDAAGPLPPKHYSFVDCKERSVDRTKGRWRRHREHGDPVISAYRRVSVAIWRSKP